MKLPKPFFFLGIIILTALACGVGDDLATPLPASLLAEISTLPPSVIPRQPRAPTLTPTPEILLPVSTVAATFPAWVTDFSDPILAALEGQRPMFEDDFPEICIDEDQKWKVCSTPERRTYYQSPISGLALATARPTLDVQPDLQDGYALLNKGWFFVVPESSKNPLYARIDNGALVLRLPEGKEKKDFWIYNPRFLQKNFVIQFDLQFGETQPNDVFRFQFEQGENQGFALELAKNQTWVFEWGAHGNQQFHMGAYEYFSPEPFRVLIIARENQCAVYLNNTPLDYFEDCRTDTNTKLSVYSTTFHILAAPGHPAVMTMDNIKFWDLDKISNLP